MRRPTDRSPERFCSRHSEGLALVFNPRPRRFERSRLKKSFCDDIRGGRGDDWMRLSRVNAEHEGLTCHGDIPTPPRIRRGMPPRGGNGESEVRIVEE